MWMVSRSGELDITDCSDEPFIAALDDGLGSEKRDTRQNESPGRARVIVTVIKDAAMVSTVILAILGVGNVGAKV
jgi:hypothetical protein